jgi:RNA polymerase sigma factor (sigma-70 family)
MISGMDAEADLVESARSGDRDAFAAIYDRYADALHDFTYSVLRDRDEAADATHDTFLIAAQRLGQLRDPSKLRPWLYAIARHEALRRARARRRVRALEAADLDAVPVESSAEATVTRAETAATVWEAAAGLSARDRALLDLHVRQGLAGQALGDAIGVTAHHADVLMSRLRAQVERSIGALLVARQGRADCPELQTVLAGWDGTFSPLWRKRVARHVDDCARCSRRRATMLEPLAALAAVGIFPAPALLRDRTLHDVGLVTSAGTAARGWRGAGQGEGFPPSMYPRSGRRRALTLLAGVLAAVVVVAVVATVVIAFAGSTTEGPVTPTTGVVVTEPPSAPSRPGAPRPGRHPSTTSTRVVATTATTAPVTGTRGGGTSAPTTLPPPR